MHSKPLKHCGWLILLLLASPMLVQADDAGSPINQNISQGIDWQTLSTEEQTLLAPFAEKWEGLPPGRQQRLRKGIKRWTLLTPEQRARAKKRFARWKKLPPEKRQRVRQRFERFMTLPPADRKRLRKRFRNFRDLPPARRAELRARWQKMSPAQRRAVMERRQMRHQNYRQQRQDTHRKH